MQMANGNFLSFFESLANKFHVFLDRFPQNTQKHVFGSFLKKMLMVASPVLHNERCNPNEVEFF